MAKAEEVTGDLAAAREAYGKYLTLMAKSRGTRAELETARRSVALR
jgi:hypothetical protein